MGAGNLRVFSSGLTDFTSVLCMEREQRLLRLAAYGLSDCSKALQTAGRVLPCWDLLPRGSPPDLLKVILWHYQTVVVECRIPSVLAQDGLGQVSGKQVAMALGFMVKRYRCSNDSFFYFR